MTSFRPGRYGPTWRSSTPAEFDEEQTLVFCCCGVEMQFRWPRDRDDVRCVGCGARFARPRHFPPRLTLIWNRDASPPSPWRAWLSPPRLLLLALTTVAAILLGLGLLAIS